MTLNSCAANLFVIQAFSQKWHDTRCSKSDGCWIGMYQIRIFGFEWIRVWKYLDSIKFDFEHVRIRIYLVHPDSRFDDVRYKSKVIQETRYAHLNLSICRPINLTIGLSYMFFFLAFCVCKHLVGSWSMHEERKQTIEEVYKYVFFSPLWQQVCSRRQHFRCQVLSGERNDVV